MKKHSRADKIYIVSVRTLVFIMAIIVLFPVLNLLAVSFSSPTAIAGGSVSFLPREFTLEAYKAVLFDIGFFRSMKNSGIVAGLGSILGVFLSICVAYPLSKKDLPGRNKLVVLFIFTMMFNGGIVPSYLLMQKMNLLNSLFSLILPSAINVFNIMIAKSYFESLPEEIEEAAKVDGASYFCIMTRIILPISTALIATLFLLFAVFYWNEYFNAKLYITSPNKTTLQLYLRTMLFEGGYNTFDFGDSRIDSSMVNYQNVNNALIFCAMLPIVLFYPAIQRYFVKGMTIGAVKG